MGTPDLKIAKPLRSRNGTAAGGVIRTQMQEEHDRLIGEHEKGSARLRAIDEEAQRLATERGALVNSLNAVGGGILTLRKVMGGPQIDPDVVAATEAPAPQDEALAAAPPTEEPAAQAPQATA